MTLHFTANVNVERFLESMPMPAELVILAKPKPSVARARPQSSEAEVLAEVQSGRRRIGLLEPEGVRGTA